MMAAAGGENALGPLREAWRTRLPWGLGLLAGGGAAALAPYGLPAVHAVARSVAPHASDAALTAAAGRPPAGSGAEARAPGGDDGASGGCSGGGGGSSSRRRSIVDLFRGAEMDGDCSSGDAAPAAQLPAAEAAAAAAEAPEADDTEPPSALQQALEVSVLLVVCRKHGMIWPPQHHC